MPRLSQCSQQVDDETLEKLAHQVVAFMLSRPDRKVPVKRTDIVKVALGDHPKSYDAVLQRVGDLLKDLGLKMVKVEQPVKAVMLVNPHRDLMPYCQQSPEDKAEGVLLLLVLSFIFMRNAPVRDDILWDYLLKLGIVKENPHFVHSYFGDVRKIVSKVFVRRMYLDCCKVPNSDPVCYEYSMGRRALVEVPKRKLLKFVCKMYGSDDLSFFRSHLQQVIKDEEEERNEEGSQEDSSQPGPSTLSQPPGSSFKAFGESQAPAKRISSSQPSSASEHSHRRRRL